tara:strand:- start:264 stop:440 length:177 start_codon:yes stop_codon:yes gene_type:complete
MNDYEKIADWIVNECDEPIAEVKWLLEEVKAHWEQQDRDIYTEYDGVFEYLKKEREVA